jgi:serine/threonine-protein kinase HipA
MNSYRWLIFNVLIANNDNHLKNLSFMVGRDGIELSPAYDPLSTGAYHTRAFAGDRADWPNVPFAITMLNVPMLEAVNRKLSGELRLLATLQHLVVPD